MSIPETLVGETPLVRLRRFEPRDGVEIYAKLESRNASGSVKDRAARAIVTAAEQAGALGSGRTLLDATSGNTGIAYAMIGAARGHRVRLCVPANITPERKRLLLAFGADLIFTDPADGTDGAIREARRLEAAAPHQYFYADQYGNPANWRAHFDTTGVEILAQTGGRVTHFVAGLGTSGTFVGTGRRLRAHDASTVLVSMQPESPLNGLEGLKHMPTALVPSIYDPSLADTNLTISTERAHSLIRRLARHEGLFVGPSSGAALAAASDVAADLRRGVVVTVFPDGGDRYASDRLWSEPDDGLEIVADVREQIDAHAAAAYPNECCGALIGRDARVETAMRLDNVSDEGQRRRFLVSPAAYRAAESEADASSRQLLGFYHSHPDHPARPSDFDLAHAWPNFSYVIVAVHSGCVVDLRSWRLRADRSRFDEEAVTPRSAVFNGSASCLFVS
ncbi:MAG TPA: pyridoxal-phosphate dependent enzyme [Vicinamibacterales bacterium]|nr:pyridoxal-phosphate dependent enzyme [Vicinamibacterales bacterium]